MRISIGIALLLAACTGGVGGGGGASKYSIGGSLTGLNGVLVLTNNGADDLTLNTSGPFTFATQLATGATYNVAVKTQPATQTCTVTNGTGAVASANVTNISVACVTNTFNVGGTVTGLADAGLILQNNGGADLSVAAAGPFSFTAIASGSAYSVTVKTQPASQTCVVSNGAGTVRAANVTSVTVNCSTNVYKLGGNVAGLVGSGLVLQNNSTDDLAVSVGGPFAFATPVASGGRYSVTVKTQPSTPTQSCAVSNASGNVANADVINVAVTCATVNGGALDTSFGTGGKFIGPPGYARGVAIQPDGKLVVLTWGASVSTDSFTLVRFNTNGDLDASFGVGGKATGNLGGHNVASESAMALVLQSDGKFVVGGTGTGATLGAGFALTRFDANGHLDTAFGTAGKVLTGFDDGHGGTQGGSLWSLTLQSDGKFVAVGNTRGAHTDYNFALTRYAPDGTVDATFGNQGRTVTDFSQHENDNGAEAVALQPDGRILVAGWNQLGGSGTDVVPALARYATDGILDATFGIAGQASNETLVGNYGGRATVLVLADGRILMSKSVDTNAVDFLVMRYTANGSPDLSFGNSGVVTTDFNGGKQQDSAQIMAVQADGKILVAGYTETGAATVFGMTRYLSSGSLDTAFGVNGFVVTDFGMGFAGIYALAIQSDGNIIAAGGASDGAQHLAIARYRP